jgi:hypothetical protein
VPCARVSTPELSSLVPCAEGEQLKQQYDSALQEWRKQYQPPTLSVKLTKNDFPSLQALYTTQLRYLCGQKLLRN